MRWSTFTRPETGTSPIAAMAPEELSESCDTLHQKVSVSAGFSFVLISTLSVLTVELCRMLSKVALGLRSTARLLESLRSPATGLVERMVGGVRLGAPVVPKVQP